MTETSVHAHRLELLAPGVGDGRVAAVGEHHRRAVGGMQHEQLHAGPDLGRLREHRLHILGADRLDVGDTAAAEVGERFGRDVVRLCSFGMCSSSCYSWPSTPFCVDWSSPVRFPHSYSVMAIDLDDALGLRPHQVDRQQPVLQVRVQHLHAVGQHEGALELARGDAAMEVLAASCRPAGGRG